MKRIRCILSFPLFALAALLLAEGTLSFSATVGAVAAASPQGAELATKDVVTSVAVAGATGRTGRFVVQKLLDREVSTVIAVVRSMERAKEVFPDPLPDNLKIVQCDLGDTSQIQSVLADGKVDAAIWCATGFSNSPDASPLEKVKRLIGMSLGPRQTIDAIALPAMAEYLKSLETPSNDKDDSRPLPKLVMCSSAGVTRPKWDQEKKETFSGAADIPIVRLNPFSILDVKRESEEKLRETGVDYCIVRPSGLNDKWPANSRPVFSQGDVAVGRINRQDVAGVLVDVLSTPESTGKTFEVITLAGYPKATSIHTALARLHTDKDAEPSMGTLSATYAAMQQLLPGTTQDAAALAMGQTYEQLDRGQEGQLGKRGEEAAEEASPKPSS